MFRSAVFSKKMRTFARYYSVSTLTAYAEIEIDSAILYFYVLTVVKPDTFWHRDRSPRQGGGLGVGQN